MLNAAQAETLAIERMIFHEVGGEETTLLDAVVDLEEHRPFFLERVRSVIRGSRYNFNDGSTVPNLLEAAANSEAAFIASSRTLAESFHAAHKGNTKAGTFFVFSLSCVTGPVWAFLKFDQPQAVAYNITTGPDGRKSAALTADPYSIHEAKSALQKAALMQFFNGVYDLRVTDRAGKYKISQYFEEFLSANRHAEPADLTAFLYESAKKAATLNPGDLSPEVARTPNQHIYQAIQRLEGYDPDTDDFLNAAFGATDEKAKIRSDFRKFLQERDSEDEPFTFDRSKIVAPTKNVMRTSEGVEISYGADSKTFVDRSKLTENGGVIIIRTAHQLARDDVS